MWMYQVSGGGGGGGVDDPDTCFTQDNALTTIQKPSQVIFFLTKYLIFL